MLSEKKKIALIVTLTAIALLISMIDVLGFIFSMCEVFNSYNRFLYEIRFIFWGWFLVFVFAGTAMGTTLYWKPGNLLLRGLVMFFSTTTILFSLAVLWMLIAMLSMEP